MALGHLILSMKFFYLFSLKKGQHRAILLMRSDGRFPVRGEVMSMTTFEKLALLLAFLQFVVTLLALLK